MKISKKCIAPINPILIDIQQPKMTMSYLTLTRESGTQTPPDTNLELLAVK